MNSSRSADSGYARVLRVMQFQGLASDPRLGSDYSRGLTVSWVSLGGFTGIAEVGVEGSFWRAGVTTYLGGVHR